MPASCSATQNGCFFRRTPSSRVVTLRSWTLRGVIPSLKLDTHATNTSCVFLKWLYNVDRLTPARSAKFDMLISLSLCSPNITRKASQMDVFVRCLRVSIMVLSFAWHPKRISALSSNTETELGINNDSVFIVHTKSPFYLLKAENQRGVGRVSNQHQYRAYPLKLV